MDTAFATPAPAPEHLAAWRHARRVLAIRLDNLGDVVMTSPALAAIKQAAPGMALTLLASPAGAAAHAHLPMVDDVITFNAPWMKGTADAAADPQAEQRLVEELAARRFDAAVIFTVCTQSALPAALLCRMAGIPLRLAHSRENPYGLLTDWVPDADVCSDGMRHEVTRQLDLVRTVGFHAASDGLTFRWQVADVMAMRRKFEQAGGDLRRPYFVVHPGVSATSRRYPPERFGAAADAIAEASGCQIVFSGGDGEQALIEQARQALRSPSIALTGLGLGELAALLAGAQLAVCNNSGPAHIAAAVGTPVVVLYALTNPQHTPWKAQAIVLNHPVPCRNCLKSTCPQGHHRCLLGVPAEAVAHAGLALMGTPPACPITA